MLKEMKNAVVCLLVLTILTGVLYPLFVTAVAQFVFNKKANGSLVIDKKGKAVASSLIGQSFERPGYFWGRLSATGPTPYNAAASSGSNYAMTNPALLDAVKARIDALKSADPTNSSHIPVDLVTASGSGLDPDISVAAARYQVTRVAKARGISEQDVQALITAHAVAPVLGVLGEVRVNVVKLNMMVDDSFPTDANMPVAGGAN